MIWIKLDYKTGNGQEVWQLQDENKEVVTTALRGHPELDEYIASLEATEPEAE
jgi:hypothetical protein